MLDLEVLLISDVKVMKLWTDKTHYNFIVKPSTGGLKLSSQTQKAFDGWALPGLAGELTALPQLDSGEEREMGKKGRDTNGEGEGREGKMKGWREDEGEERG